MAKKQMDNLSKDMIQCKKDGYGVWYGRWKATQPIKKPEPVTIPEDWKVCPHCGKAFKPRVPQQKYREANCGYEAGKIKYKEKRKEYTREYKARKKAEASA